MAFSRVDGGTRTPRFNDMIRVALPAHMTAKTHLFFTFYHVNSAWALRDICVCVPCMRDLLMPRGVHCLSQCQFGVFDRGVVVFFFFFFGYDVLLHVVRVKAPVLVCFQRSHGMSHPPLPFLAFLALCRCTGVQPRSRRRAER